MNNLPIYDDLVSLNRDQHRQLKLAPADSSLTLATYIQ